MTRSENTIKNFFDGLTKVVQAITEHSWAVAKGTAIVVVTVGISPIVRAGITQNTPFFQLAVFFVVFIVAVIGLISIAAKSDRKDRK